MARKKLGKVTPIFIGGGWRSGTSLLHATICTSPRVNPYVAECVYFSALVQAYATAGISFEPHNEWYFSSPKEMIESHRTLLRRELRRTWTRLERPEILALKNPLLTPHFALLGSLLPEARFIVSVRDPRDVLASRIEVVRRLGRAVDEDFVRAQCAEYLQHHEGLHLLGERLCVIRYEDFVNGDLTALQRLGLTDLRPDLLWQTGPLPPKGDPYETDLFGKKLSPASIGRFRQALDERMENLILDLCGPCAQNLLR